MEAIPLCDKIEVYTSYIFIYLHLHTTIFHNSEKTQLITYYHAINNKLYFLIIVEYCCV